MSKVEADDAAFTTFSAVLGPAQQAPRSVALPKPLHSIKGPLALLVGDVGRPLLLLAWTVIIGLQFYSRGSSAPWDLAFRELRVSLEVVPIGLAGAAVNLLRIAVIVLAALGYGPALLGLAGRPKGMTGLEQLLVSVGLGFAVLMYEVLAIGSLGALNGHVLWGPVGIGLLLLLGAVIRVRTRGPEAFRRVRVPHVGLSWLAMAPWLLLSGIQAVLSIEGLVSPELETDAWAYHLGAPKTYLELGRMVPLNGGSVPNIWYSNMPFSQEMLYTLVLGVGDTATGKALHFTMTILAALIAFTLGRRLHSRLAGVIAGTLFFLTPIVTWESTTADNDIALALYEGLSVLLLVIWASTRQRRALVFAGLMAGLGVGIKFTGVYVLIATVVTVLVWWWLHDRSQRSLREFALLLVAFIPVSVWLVRSAIFIGNPIFPIGDPALFPVIGSIDGTWRELLTTQYGLGRSLADYLALPWTLTLRGDAFQGTPGPLYLVLIPAALFLKDRQGSGLLLAVTGLWFVAWALGSQQARFLIPGLLLGASLGGMALADAMSGRSVAARTIGAGVAVGAFALCVLNLPTFGSTWQSGHWILGYEVPWQSLRNMAAGIPIEQQLEESNPVFRTAVVINSELPEGAGVYVLDGAVPALYANRVAIAYDDWIGEGVLLRSSLDRREGADELRRAGLTYIYSSGLRIKLLEQAPWFDRLQLIYQNGNDIICAILPEWRASGV